MTDTKPELIWVDIETTGLEAEENIILELALVLTNHSGDIIADDSWVIFNDSDDSYYDHIYRARNDVNQFINNMHTKSGLWDDVSSPEGAHFLQDAEEEAVRFLSENGAKWGDLPMAGSSISGVDRPFMRHHMPTLYDFFHYRSLDVSSIKLATLGLAPAVADAWKAECATMKTTNHRALDDAYMSLTEYKFYIENFFRL